jgi:membrane associated rhomboid family serine protease
MVAWATYSVVAANVVVWLFITLFVSGDQAKLSSFLMSYGVSQASLKGVNPTPFITYMFIYEKPFHMLLDVFLLLIFGRIVERHLGAARFLFLYFSSGVAVALYHALHLLFSCPLYTTTLPECLTPLVGSTGAALAIAASVLNIYAFFYVILVKPGSILRIMPLASFVGVLIGELLVSLMSGGWNPLSVGLASGLILSYVLLKEELSGRHGGVLHDLG